MPQVRFQLLSQRHQEKIIPSQGRKKILLSKTDGKNQSGNGNNQSIKGKIQSTNGNIESSNGLIESSDGMIQSSDGKVKSSGPDRQKTTMT
jgi:hypothetical protein